MNVNGDLSAALIDPAVAPDHIKSEVRQRYAGIAASGGGCCDSSGCCGDDGACGSDVLALIDYGALDAGIIEGANLGLGCGIPTQFAALRPGETVLDLGSGAGIDAFLAARAVGEGGHVIGVDFTPEMIARARANAVKGGVANVEFRQGDIEALPVDSASIDLVLSNCVLNLVPDKARAFAEIRRVLRAGGRFVISDVVSFGPMPAAMRADMALWAGCVAGAMDRDAYLDLIRAAGFPDVQVVATTAYDAHKGDDHGLMSITIGGTKV